MERVGAPVAAINRRDPKWFLHLSINQVSASVQLKFYTANDLGELPTAYQILIAFRCTSW